MTMNRRDFVAGSSSIALASTLLPALSGGQLFAEEPQKITAYFGTYTGPQSEGIYLADFDATTGALGKPRLAAKTEQPSFLALHPSGKLLYACNETGDFEGKSAGAITAFAIEEDGTLTALNQKTSSGAAPCHLVVDKTGKNVLAANYSGGNVCVYALTEKGELGEQTAFVQHRGPRTHAHSINVDAGNRFALAADLGLDEILVYKLDAAKGTLTPNDPPAGQAVKGGGPRHFAFHPSGKYGYVCNETLSSVTAFAYDAEKGTLAQLNTESTLPHKVEGNSTAEVQVHPSGKFVYVSNRGHNSIAIFQIDAATGKVSKSGHQTQGVNIPRNFGIDPSGQWMVVCNQAGNNAIVFKIDQESGALSPTEHAIELGSPVCVKFLKHS